MTTAVAPSRVSTDAFDSLARLQQLTLEAGLSDTLAQLIFRILNRSIIYCRYDRAVLWDLRGGRTKLLGVSGNPEVTSRSPLADEWRCLVCAMSDRDTSAIVEGAAFPGREDTWDALAGRTEGLSVIWLPIAVEGQTVAGLWLERWGESLFTEDEMAKLEPLALAYGVAWRGVVRPRSRLLGALSSRKRVAAMTALLLLIVALCLVRLPLRIVAHCEVVPRDPVAVAAPLDGVIDEVSVLPGRTVRRGEALAVYDKRVATEELKVAEEQVQIIESNLQRSRVQSFDDPSARSAIALLESRLEQERIRLRIAQHRVDQLDVVAPVGGTLMFDDPHQWRGRPVQVGQRLMMIVDPAKTKLRIWLPDGDNIKFDWGRKLAVILDSDPLVSRRAALRFVSNHSQISSDGAPRFRAEADWVTAGSDVKTGLQGTVILYGDSVPLGYWLLRRPLGAVRKFSGI